MTQDPQESALPRNVKRMVGWVLASSWQCAGYEVSGGIQEVCFKVAGSCVQTVPVPACQYHCSDTRFLSLGFARVSGFSMVVIQISTDYLYSLVHIYLRSILFTLASDFWFCADIVRTGAGKQIVRMGQSHLLIIFGWAQGVRKLFNSFITSFQ